MRKSRLSKYKQQRLIELFVAGSTSRVAASLVDVNKMTASYYFHRLRLLIFNHSEHLELLKARLKRMRVILEVDVKGNEGEERAVKYPCLGF